MSDTPITDANTWTTICGNLKGSHSDNEDELYVPVSVSRKLEGELNVANIKLSNITLAFTKSNEEICQTAGKALGYPWFKDDQKNFPGSTEECGVCVGEHVAETIVAELAAKYAEANERIKKLELELEKAWRMYHKAAGKI